MFQKDNFYDIYYEKLEKERVNIEDLSNVFKKSDLSFDINSDCSKYEINTDLIASFRLNLRNKTYNFVKMEQKYLEVSIIIIKPMIKYLDYGFSFK